MDRLSGGVKGALHVCALVFCALLLAIPLAAFSPSPRAGGEAEERVEEHACAQAKLAACDAVVLRRRVQVASRGRLVPHVPPRARVPRHLEAPVRHDTKRLPLRC